MQAKRDQELIQCVRVGDLNGVRAALQRGASPNALYQGEFALSWIRKAPVLGTMHLDGEHGSAVYTFLKNHDPIVRLLVEHGAAVNVMDASGFSVLDRASLHGQRGLVEFLKKKGARFSRYQDNGSEAKLTALFAGLAVYLPAELVRLDVEAENFFTAALRSTKSSDALLRQTKTIPGKQTYHDFQEHHRIEITSGKVSFDITIQPDEKSGGCMVTVEMAYEGEE